MLRIILREIRHRKTNSALLFLSVAAAAALVAATHVVLTHYKTAQEREMALKEENLEKEMHRIWDDYRRITKDLGFNVLILPEEQNLADFFADDFASTYMPEEYAVKLAQSRIVTVQHILPTLLVKTRWPEKKRTVLVYGVRGEIPRHHLGKKKRSPILEAVPEDGMVLGYELWNGLGLRTGDRVVFREEVFTVTTCHGQRGNRDDISLWIGLERAQNLFHKQGLINSILALECRCTSVEDLPNLAGVRKDVAGILPGTKVIEFMSEVLARAEARYKAVKLKEDGLAAEKRHRAAALRHREKTAQWIASLIVAGCAFVVGLLGSLNMRERRTEVGIFRALGLDNRRLVSIFLGKPLVIASVAGLFGCALGLAAGRAWGNMLIGEGGRAPFDIGVIAAVLVATPVVALGATLVPVRRALRLDPALILKDAL